MEKKKPTIEELEAILRSPNCRFSTVIKPNGGLDSVPTECGKEVNLLKKLYDAALLLGSPRKHDCPGFDCSTCNSTAILEAMNDLENYYSPDPPSGTVMPNGSEF